ncbi:DUF4188 domain-containing protein [Streptomyces sp. NPDC056347]|uniref:DUF4188 domain-containing protein n=1 Tax=Streptomyces sp. NPDC056347 TaxID=3345790 RepID=UPI0035E3AFED
MPQVHRGRHTAHIEGDFVVFLIGMHVNRPWRIHRWWPVFRSMFGMVKDLREHPEKGALCTYFALISGVGPTVVQYWRSFEQLEAFARKTDDPHLPSWRRYNQRVLKSGDVGIWHETYLVKDGQYETVYANMGRIGLARAGELKPVQAKGHTAGRRLGRTAEDDFPAGTRPGDGAPS